MSRPRTFGHGATRKPVCGGASVAADLILSKVGEWCAVPPAEAVRAIAAQAERGAMRRPLLLSAPDATVAQAITQPSTYGFIAISSAMRRMLAMIIKDLGLAPASIARHSSIMSCAYSTPASVGVPSGSVASKMVCKSCKCGQNPGRIANIGLPPSRILILKSYEGGTQNSVTNFNLAGECCTLRLYGCFLWLGGRIGVPDRRGYAPLLAPSRGVSASPFARRGRCAASPGCEAPGRRHRKTSRPGCPFSRDRLRLQAADRACVRASHHSNPARR
jgi:hypothetical protein